TAPKLAAVGARNAALRVKLQRYLETILLPPGVANTRSGRAHRNPPKSAWRRYTTSRELLMRPRGAGANALLSPGYALSSQYDVCEKITYFQGGTPSESRRQRSLWAHTLFSDASG